MPILLHDKHFELLFEANTIASKVDRLARQLDAKWLQRPGIGLPLVIGVLKGAAIFHADLVRKIKSPIEIGYLRTRSYEGSSSTGQLRLEWPDDLLVENRDLVFVEDIIDSGYTMRVLAKAAKDRGAKSILTVALLDKPDARRAEFEPDLVGFTIKPEFVVGYGLDYDGLGRNLPAIYRESAPEGSEGS